MEKITNLILALLFTSAGIFGGFAQNTECTGTSNELSQGSGLGNYTYSFTMSGSDVVMEFEPLSPLVGLVAYSWHFNPGLSETPMTNVGGQKFRKTFTGLAGGSTLNVAVKFAWAAGGFAVTKQFQYTVGTVCGGGLPAPTFGPFEIPAKTLGDPAFSLTAPTSNSSGAFTFTSSNTSVAQISGSTVTIVGAGTSTITASQAATASFSAGSTSATLVVAAPPAPASPTQPARNPQDVISIYSSAYADMAGTDFNPNWGQAGNWPGNMTTPLYGGDEVRQYQNTSHYQGMRLGNDIDVNTINKLHVDIYSPTLTSVNLYLIKTTGGNFETFQTINLTPGAWTTVNLNVNSTTFPGLDLSMVREIKFAEMRIGAAITGDQVLAIDNFYFYKEPGIAPTLGTFTIPAHVLGDAPFSILPPTSNSIGAWTFSSSNTSVAQISGSTLTITGAGTSIITATQAADGIFTSASATAEFVVTVPPLSTAAPNPPARNAWDVVSVYSNAYETSLTPNWQNAATTSDELLQGNDTKKMSNFLIELVNFAPIDVSQMTTLHIDVYSEDCSGMNIWLLNNGDRNAQITIIPNQWNSIDIPLTTYSNQGLIMNAISLIKFESLNGPGKTVWVDNIYFFRPPTALPPTITDFVIPAKNFGDPDFQLTPPTSNSSGAFTYTSGNTNIATISGNTVHIVAPGTVTITATQAADGSFGGGSISAQLTIAFPAPGPSPIPADRPAERVVSMFTGNPPVYENAINAVRAYWTAATTLTEIPNGTNTALRLDNFGFLGLVDENETLFDASGMSHLNMDIYLNEPLNANPALSRIFVFLLSNGDHLYEVSNLVAGWNTIRIPLANFPGATLSAIYGLKFEQNSSPLTQIYLDNIYFSNECYTYYADADGDGYGDAASPISLCEPTPGFVLDNTDCNDSAMAINPGQAEIPYNGIDDNCDGTIDEGSQLLSQVLPAQCGTTLTSIGSLIGAVSFGGGVNGYRFEVTNMQNNSVQVIDRSVPNFSLTSLASYDYATTYSIRVMLRRNGIWLNYFGNSCLVSTPAILDPGGAAAVSPSQCGIVLPTLSTLIATTSLPGVTAYRFRVTNLTDPEGPEAQQTIERNLHWFALTMLSRFNYGTEYQIEVSVKTANGSWSGFGAPCNVTSPAVPTLANCGAVIPAKSTYIQTTSLNRVQAYRFEVTNMETFEQSVVDRTLHYFSFANVSNYAPGTSYSVRVAVQTSGHWSPFGEACLITSPGAARSIAISDDKEPILDFRAVVYPNPYTESFALDIDLPSQDNVQVKVYDMIGKLVEAREFGYDAIENQQFGERYPSGVYNIAVVQAGNTKTLRVVKR